VARATREQCIEKKDRHAALQGELTTAGETLKTLRAEQTEKQLIEDVTRQELSDIDFDTWHVKRLIEAELGDNTREEVRNAAIRVDEIDERLDEIDTRQGELDDLGPDDTGVEDPDGEWDDLETERTELEDERGPLAELAAVDERVSALEDELPELEADRETIAARFEAAFSDKQEAEGKVWDAQEALYALQASIRQVVAQYDEYGCPTLTGGIDGETPPAPEPEPAPEPGIDIDSEPGVDVDEDTDEDVDVDSDVDSDVDTDTDADSDPSSGPGGN